MIRTLASAARGARPTASPPSVSVVIPCWNAERWIDHTIKSVLDQNYPSLEVIVVDDGSSDDSLAIARGYAPKVRVLTGPNRGVSVARNRGVSKARKEWIVFLDSDDLLLPGTLRMRLDVAEATCADVVVCDWQELIDRPDDAIGDSIKSVDLTALEADTEIACATNVWAPPAALMYQRSLVEKIGGFRQDLPIIQDARFLFDAACCGARFAHSPHVGARYRVHERSLSRSDPGRFWRDLLTNGRQIEAVWHGRGKLSPNQHEALAGIYNQAARGLFAAEHPDYFEAVKCQRALGGQLPLHPSVAAPLARAIGLWGARCVLACVGR